MDTLFKQKGGSVVVVGDGKTARHIADTTQLAKVADLQRRGIFRLTPGGPGALEPPWRIELQTFSLRVRRSTD